MREIGKYLLMENRAGDYFIELLKKDPEDRFGAFDQVTGIYSDAGRNITAADLTELQERYGEERVKVSEEGFVYIEPLEISNDPSV